MLHYIGKVFKGYKVIGKSLIRVVRNADIDADALYDEDLDYREFMADLMKQRRKLTPVRLDMSREIDVSVVESPVQIPESGAGAGVPFGRAAGPFLCI